MATNAIKKQTKGRRKIEMKKIESKTNLEVTFSKRRSGLFKKASELCILCGAELAIIVFKPNNQEKAVSFGHPSTDIVINRYLGSTSLELSPGHGPAHVEESKKQYKEAVEKCEEKRSNLEMMIKEVKQDEEEKKQRGLGFWWERLNIGEDGGDDHMVLKELEYCMASLREIKKKVQVRVDDINKSMASSSVDNHNYVTNFSGYGF